VSGSETVVRVRTLLYVTILLYHCADAFSCDVIIDNGFKGASHSKVFLMKTKITSYSSVETILEVWRMSRRLRYIFPTDGKIISYLRIWNSRIYTDLSSGLSLQSIRLKLLTYFSSPSCMLAVLPNSSLNWSPTWYFVKIANYRLSGCIIVPVIYISLSISLTNTPNTIYSFRVWDYMWL
jgi:hypothetical protein